MRRALRGLGQNLRTLVVRLDDDPDEARAKPPAAGRARPDGHASMRQMTGGAGGIIDEGTT